MRFGKVSFMASTALFMGVAAVLAGSVLKLAYMGLGGIPLWNAANALQTIGLLAISATFLLNVKTLMEQDPGLERIARYIPPRTPGMRFADLSKPDRDPAPHAPHSPLGDALQKIAEKKGGRQGDPQAKTFGSRPDAVATAGQARNRNLGGDQLNESGDESGEYGAFTAHEPARHEPERLDGKGERPTATEHCFAGSDGENG